ncbi:MAG: DUF503 domain-containing protein [candidate division WOR-3 bacterium]|nr:DUF503 domain-containing protein [candidate division WOR-3 bacterium]MCX7837131.1 DUF503 domain-containing protein [candidate division WOR-3 bacterium]MDW8113660.1 DUF503 domain-containing protein [candidate division WOR-3 bacterium]
MTVSLLIVDCLYKNSHSLKEKRRFINSLFSRLKKEFNVSVLEIDYQDLWQRSKLAICFINNSTDSSLKTQSSLLKFLENYPNLTILDHQYQKLY